MNQRLTGLARAFRPIHIPVLSLPHAILFSLLATCTLWVKPGFAYTYESLVGEGCHETLTATALREVRLELATATPLPTTDADRLFIDDLPFRLVHDMRDIGAASLLVGVRENDVKGFSGIDTSALPHVHSNPDHQREHCLRRTEHDEPQGSVEALAECRAFVESKLRGAIHDGLDENGFPDPERRESLRVHLVFRRQVTVALPTFYLELGRALHTLQDSFTHGFRTPDHKRITVLSNWVDQVDDLVESRDGPPHLGKMDLCQDLDAFRSERLSMAQRASVDLLRAALHPADDQDERVRAVTETLDEYMSFEPGCHFANDWCDAQENSYRPSVSCQMSQSPGRCGWWWLCSFALLFRCRRKPCA